MGRLISCIGCNRYLGEIEVAKLHKDIKYLCPDCDTKRIASDLAKKSVPYDMPDFFSDLFGGKR